MTAKRSARLNRPTAQVVSGAALPDSLAETRVSVLHLARQALEAKDAALAKQLTAQGQALRAEIARHRKAAHAAWMADAKTIVPRLHAAQSRLSRLIEAGEKSAKRRANLTRALGAVSAILTLSRKVL
jgi:hypothetical protein